MTTTPIQEKCECLCHVQNPLALDPVDVNGSCDKCVNNNCSEVNIPTPIQETEKMVINRVWAMPSMHTFTIKPISRLLDRYVGKETLFSRKNGIWIDPFAGENSPAQETNDHNPEKPTKYHMEAIDFVNMFGNEFFDGALFDPPYSYRQVSEHYKVIGKKATPLDTSTNFYNKVLNPLANKIKVGGYCISFGWNSNGMGKNRGFEIVEILLVAHGGRHNDTLVTVERKL